MKRSIRPCRRFPLCRFCCRVRTIVGASGAPRVPRKRKRRSLPAVIRFYAKMDYENAESYLRRAVAMDSTYADPAADLGFLHYDVGMHGRREELSLACGGFSEGSFCGLRTRRCAWGTMTPRCIDQDMRDRSCFNDNRAFLTLCQEERGALSVRPAVLQSRTCLLWGGMTGRGRSSRRKEGAQVEKFKQSQLRIQFSVWTIIELHTS